MCKLEIYREQNLPLASQGSEFVWEFQNIGRLDHGDLTRKGLPNHDLNMNRKQSHGGSFKEKSKQ